MLYLLPAGVEERGSSIDETDLSLISLLQVNGRASFKNLADQLGIPEKQVARKVTQLIAKGVIQVAPVCNPSTLGLASIAMLAVRLKGDASPDTFVDEILELGFIDYAAVTINHFDLLIEILAEDDATLLQLIRTHIRSRQDVEFVEAYSYIGLLYQQPVWDEAQRSFSSEMGIFPVESKELDATDRKLVALLSCDGRATFQSLAGNLGVSESYVRKRYAALMERGDFGVHALTNPQSLGYVTHCWLFLKADCGRSVISLAQELAGLEHVAYVAVCTGTADILIEVICRSKDELRELVGERLASIAGAKTMKTVLCTQLFYRSVKYGNKNA